MAVDLLEDATGRDWMFDAKAKERFHEEGEKYRFYILS